MAISEPYELDGVSVGATELSIASGTTTLQSITDDGVYQLFLDPIGAGLAKGDEFMVRIKEKVLAGSTQRTVIAHRITRLTQSENLVYPTLFLLHGWDMTLQKITGTDRNWDASIRKVAGAGITEYDSLSAVSVSSANELSIYSGTTTLQAATDDGFYQLWLDPFAAGMVKGDTFRAKIKEKVEGTGGVQRILYQNDLENAPAELWVSPTLCLINGHDMTLQKIAGTDRSWDASVRRAA